MGCMDKSVSTAPNLSAGGSPRYLKQAGPPAREVTDEIRRRVESMLVDIEDGGLDAVRRYSHDLDNWDPDSFVVADDEFERAAAELDDRCSEHIAFAQNQVRTFAQAQRATLTELEVETRRRASCSATTTSRSTRSVPTSRAAAIRCWRRRS